MAALNEASPGGAYAPICGNDGFFSSRRGSIFLDEDCIVYFNKWDVVNKGEFETTFNLTTVPVLRAYPKPCDLRLLSKRVPAQGTFSRSASSPFYGISMCCRTISIGHEVVFRIPSSLAPPLRIFCKTAGCTVSSSWAMRDTRSSAATICRAKQ